MLAVGLIAFALWSLIQAVFDTDREGRDAKGIIARLNYAVIGISYGLLGIGAIQLAVGVGNGGRSSTSSVQSGTGILLREPFGQVLVIIIGILVVGIGLYLFYRAYTAKFKEHLSLTGLGARARKIVIAIGRAGHAALGAVFLVVGIFLIIAALQDNAGRAKGLDGALQALAHQPFGQILLGLVALGLLAYGLYSFVEARYRRLGRA